MSARKRVPKLGTFLNPCLDSPLVDNHRFGWDELRRLQEAWHNPQCAFVRICCVCVCVCVCVLCFCCIAFGTTAIADRMGWQLMCVYALCMCLYVLHIILFMFVLYRV